MVAKANPWARDIDFDKARSLVSELNLPKTNYDKLESGSKYVSNFRRICPPTENAELPFHAVPVHFLGPNNRPVACPRLLTGGSAACPVCQYGFELSRQGHKDEGKDFLPNWRVYLNVVRLNAEGEVDPSDDAIFVLRLNQTQFSGNQESDEDEALWPFFEEFGDLSHVESGRNIEIRAKNAKRGNYEYQKAKFSVTDPCEFPGNLDILDGMYDLSALVPMIAPEQMIAISQGTDTSASGLLPSAGDIVDGEVVDGEVTAASEEPQPATKPGGFSARNDEEEEEEEEKGQNETTPAANGSKAKPVAAAPKTNRSEALNRLQKRTGK